LNVAELARAVEAVEGARAIIFCCMGSSSIAAEVLVVDLLCAGFTVRHFEETFRAVKSTRQS